MNSIRVKNFRSIKDSGQVDICPLTVVVGKNSAGKSSFVRLLPLIKQTLERKISDTLLWYGDYVDFGDFNHTVFKYSKDEPIVISFSLLGYERRYRRIISKKAVPIQVELIIRADYIEKIIVWYYDQQITIEINSTGKARIIINDDERPFASKEIETIRKPGRIIPSLYDKSEKYTRIWGEGLNTDNIQSYIKKYIGTNIERFFIPFNDEDTISMASKEDILKQLKRLNEAKFGRMKQDHKRFNKINNYLIALWLEEILDTVNESFFEEVQQTRYIKPIRAMVDRYYRVQRIYIDELDADGGNLPMILKNMRPSELNAFEKWSRDKFGVVFSVEPGEGHISLIVKNEVDGSEHTNVADTGYGYSQMLPIVMLLWMIHNKRPTLRTIKDRIVIIEQPELHLHPAYQAKMIDVFVGIIHEAKAQGINIKFILETHSEAIINRIGSLISENRINADLVNTLIFNKEDGVTSIQSIKFDEDGLLNDWPIDFFATEDREHVD